MIDTTAAPDGWEGILEPGERVLWQGQPDRNLDWSDMDRRQVLFGLVFAAIAMFWTIGVLTATAGTTAALVMPLFGLVFLAIGLHKAGGSVFLAAWQRRGTWYTLTDRRAFIATDLAGRKTLEAYPIDATTKIDHDPRAGHIWFATDFVKKGKSSKKRRIGFTHLPETRDVFDLISKVQDGRV